MRKSTNLSAASTCMTTHHISPPVCPPPQVIIFKETINWKNIFSSNQEISFLFIPKDLEKRHRLILIQSIPLQVLSANSGSDYLHLIQYQCTGRLHLLRSPLISNTWSWHQQTAKWHGSSRSSTTPSLSYCLWLFRIYNVLCVRNALVQVWFKENAVLFWLDMILKKVATF